MRVGLPLRGERVVLRDYTPEDLTFCTDLWFDPENGRYLSDPDAAHVDEAYRQALEAMQDSKDGYYFIVELAETGERIGTCCAFPDAAGEEYDIGYCIHKARWRQGYGTETVSLLAGWARAQGGSVLTAEAALENAASCALLKKCGFQVRKAASFRKYHMDAAFESAVFFKKLSDSQHS